MATIGFGWWEFHSTHPIGLGRPGGVWRAIPYMNWANSIVRNPPLLNLGMSDSGGISVHCDGRLIGFARGRKHPPRRRWLFLRRPQFPEYN